MTGLQGYDEWKTTPPSYDNGVDWDCPVCGESDYFYKSYGNEEFPTCNTCGYNDVLSDPDDFIAISYMDGGYKPTVLAVELAKISNEDLVYYFMAQSEYIGSLKRDNVELRKSQERLWEEVERRMK